MFRLTTLFPISRPRKRKIIRELRRLRHQRNYWRNRTLGRPSRRRR